MRIDIDNKYVITSDSRNIILSKKAVVQSGKHKGEEELRESKFFGSLESLFQTLFKLKIRQSAATTFKELHEDIIWAKREICMLLEGL